MSQLSIKMTKLQTKWEVVVSDTDDGGEFVWVGVYGDFIEASLHGQQVLDAVEDKRSGRV